MDSSASAEPPQKRLKTRNACEPCKVRKKKCDGDDPCTQCIRYDYNCRYNIRQTKAQQHYAGNPHSSHKASDSPHNDHDSPVVHNHASPSDRSQSTAAATPTQRPAQLKRDNHNISGLTAAETASASTFSRRLGMHFDTDVDRNEGTTKVRGAMWNLGLRDVQPKGGYAEPVTKFLTQDRLEHYAIIHYNAMRHSYEVLTRAELLLWCKSRYQGDESKLKPVHDAVLSAIGAIGMHFSEGPDVDLELQLFNNARLCIDAAGFSSPASGQVFARMMVLLYARLTLDPHACWMLSCSTIHLGEAVGLFSSPPREQPTASIEHLSPASCLRLALLTRTMNAWISFECLQPRLEPANPGFDQRSLKELLPLEQLGRFAWIIDPHESPEISDVETVFAQVEDIECHVDSIQLSKSFLALSIYRRRFVIHPNIPTDFKQRVIRQGTLGLKSIERLLLVPQPWWHLCHLTLQFLCVLLVMETAEALGEVGNTLKVMEKVQQRWDSEGTRETLKYARHIVKAAMRRLQRDHALLAIAIGDTEKATQPKPGLNPAISSFVAQSRTSGHPTASLLHHTSPTASMGQHFPAAYPGQLAYPSVPGVADTTLNQNMNSWDDFNWDLFTFSGTAAFDSVNYPFS